MSHGHNRHHHDVVVTNNRWMPSSLPTETIAGLPQLARGVSEPERPSVTVLGVRPLLSVYLGQTFHRASPQI